MSLGRWQLLAAMLVLAVPRLAKGFDLLVADPAYPQGAGPRVLYDSAHANQHALDGFYAAFGTLLANDGYAVEVSPHAFTHPEFLAALGEPDCLRAVRARFGAGEALSDTPARSLVIVNAQVDIHATEADVIRQWVACGGTLFLVVDHDPLAEASRTLAGAFGLEFTPGGLEEASAQRVTGTVSHAALYDEADGSLDPAHPVVLGRRPSEVVGHVATMHGSGIFVVGDFLEPRPFRWVRPLLTALEGSTYVDPSTHQEVDPAADMFAAVALVYGRGRIYVSGEARMHTVVPDAPIPGGMDAPFAGFNKQFILNTLHWLDARLCEGAGDLDADGICDALDLCLTVPDTEQRDTDQDGFGDRCDPTQGAPPGPSGLECAGTIPCALPVCTGGPDRDADGVCDADDACLVEPDPFQGDADLDGYGDSCDPPDAPPGPSGLRCAGSAPCVPPRCESASDMDGDGICDGRDSCSEEFDPFPWDGNGDGYGDRCDPDFDGDGIVGGPDLMLLGRAYGSSRGDARYDADLDLDGDGTIDADDYDALSRKFTRPPGPSGLACAGSPRCP